MRIAGACQTSTLKAGTLLDGFQPKKDQKSQHIKNYRPYSATPEKTDIYIYIYIYVLLGVSGLSDSDH